MKSVLVSTILLAACATTSVPSLGESDGAQHTGSRVQLDLTPSADATRVFPQAIDPRLPGADRLAAQIRAELGDAASVEVKLCVVPGGHVDSVEVTRGSSLAAFDRSVMADAMSWQFAATPGPTGVRTCEHATITYRPRA